MTFGSNIPGAVLTSDRIAAIVTEIVAASGGSESGPVTATGTTVARALPDIAADTANVLQFCTPAQLAAADASAAVKAAHDAAYALKFRYLYFPPTVQANCPTLEAVQNVIFTGPGQVIGAYRKHVVPQHAPPGRYPLFGVTPATHLKRFLQAVAVATPTNPAVVVLWGDSTTEGGSPITGTEKQYEIVLRRMVETFGLNAANILVLNYGIGATLWNSANGTSLTTDVNGNFIANFTQHPWYPDPTKPWAYYVIKAGPLLAGPDLIIPNFGQNDGLNFDLSQMHGALNRVLDPTTGVPLRFGLPPDIVFMTNYNPSMMTGIEGISGKVGQDGHDFVAGYTRSYANKYGYGLIDQGRLATMARDGFDMCEQTIKQTVTAQVSALPYTLPTPTYDFMLYLDFANGVTSVWGQTNTDGTPAQLIIPLSQKPGNNLLLEKDPATNCIAYTVMAGNGILTPGAIVSRPRTVSDVSCFSAECLIQVVAKSGRLYLYAYGFQILDDTVERHGGLFTPSASMSNGTTPAVTITAGISQPTLYMPTIIDDEMFGIGTSQTVSNVLQPYGGNGENHMTSYGVQVIMARAFNDTQFA